jgi:hypothetical protein
MKISSVPGSLKDTISDRDSTTIMLWQELTQTPMRSNAGGERLGKSASFFPVRSTALFGGI